MEQRNKERTEPTALAEAHVRADGFVKHWQELTSQPRGTVETQMRDMARSLARDPQVEHILRERKHELGLQKDEQGQSLVKAMEQAIERRRGYDREFER